MHRLYTLTPLALVFAGLAAGCESTPAPAANNTVFVPQAQTKSACVRQEVKRSRLARCPDGSVASVSGKELRERGGFPSTMPSSSNEGRR